MSSYQPPPAGPTSSTPTAPASWPFAAKYDQPLPAHLQFDPLSGFSAMVDYVKTQLPSKYPTTQLKICPAVATYHNGKTKNAWKNQDGLSKDEQKAYADGDTVSTAQKGWTTAGTVGVVTSCLSSASDQSQGFNDWHTVAMARKGNVVWVHDPAYDASAYIGKVKRVDGVNGTSIVHQLVQSWRQVEGVYFQGPPTGYGPDQMECMGRSVQWVEETVAGRLPWPPNNDPSGGTWTWHARN